LESWEDEDAEAEWEGGCGWVSEWDLGWWVGGLPFGWVLSVVDILECVFVVVC
jgi:hypothetical protein